MQQVQLIPLLQQLGLNGRQRRRRGRLDHRPHGRGRFGRTALLRKLKEIFSDGYQSRLVGRVVRIINPILRGRVN